jgi:hypothetical protein
MSEDKGAARKEKDLWDKLQIIFHPLNGLLTAVAVALLGYFTSSYLRSTEESNTNQRVYSELMSSREQAESALRKDMFLSIIETFQRPDSGGLEGRMLNLELLTYNFHDSLNLKPLFAHMVRLIAAQPPGDAKDAYVRRLNQMGRDITTRQLVLLEQVGTKFSRNVDFEKLKTEGILELAPEKLTLGKYERELSLSVLAFNPDTREIRVEMGVRTLKTPPSPDASTHESSAMQLRRFQIGYFDFPMIDNTRLSGDQRAAVVITQANDSSADLTVVYFPGSYASLKERASSEEIVEQLRSMGQQN